MAEATTSVRESYAARFGETEAAALEAAAHYHENGINEADGYGADPFKWVCLIAIGYQCAEEDGYRAYHEITAPWSEIKAWMKESGELHTHTGGLDYLTLMAGKYAEYMPGAVR